jgi:hypothetical protein
MMLCRAGVTLACNTPALTFIHNKEAKRPSAVANAHACWARCARWRHAQPPACSPSLTLSETQS